VITARAIGILEEIAMRPSHGGAVGLSKVLGEGREAIQSSLTLLRREGLIETVTNKMKNGRIISNLQITSAGIRLLETRMHTLQTQLNSNLLLSTYSINYKPNSERGSREEESVEYYDSEEEREEARRKHQAAKHREKLDLHEKRRSERMARRDVTNADSWTSTDSTFEFAEQMHRLWHIAPWEVTRSRFRYALDNKRKEYNTDGAIERLMMERFFDKIKHDKKLNNPELVWKRFIIEFGSLYLEVSSMLQAQDNIEVIKEEALKSQEWLDNV